MLNPDMEFYKLAGLADVGNMKVKMMTGEGYDERGVIGLGEPPFDPVAEAEPRGLVDQPVADLDFEKSYFGEWFHLSSHRLFR